MRLTRAGEYAVRCVLYLARKPLGQVVSRQEVAAGGRIPPLFLAKIAQDLARAGVIEIRQGAKGGFRLLVPPAELTLLAIIEAIIGEIFLNDCVMQPASCTASESCAIHQVWIKARNQLRQTLGEVTFAQLLADESCCVLTCDLPLQAGSKSISPRPPAGKP